MADLKRRVSIRGKFGPTQRGSAPKDSSSSASPYEKSPGIQKIHLETETTRRIDLKTKKGLHSKGPKPSRSSVVHPRVPTSNKPLPGTEVEPKAQPTTFADDDVAPEFTKSPENTAAKQDSAPADNLNDVAGSEVAPSVEKGNTTAVSNEEAELSEEAAQNVRVSFRDRMRSKKAKIAAAVGVVGTTVSIVGIVALLPNFLMKQMTRKLTDAFMDTSAYALRTRTEAYIKSYVTNIIGPSTTCGVKVERGCQVFDPGQSLPSKLYSTWSKNRIEDKLFKNYGLEFEMDTREPNKIHIFKTDADGVRSEMGVFGRNSVTREATRLIDAETRFEGLVARRHVRSLLSRPPFNAEKFCLIACNKKDEILDFKISAITKLKTKLIGRIVAPINPQVATYMLCFVVSCKNAEGEAAEAALSVLKQADSELIKSIAKEIEESGAKSYKQYIIGKIGTFVIRHILMKGQEEAVKEVTVKSFLSAIPAAGQIYFAITMADFLDSIDQKIKDNSISKYMRTINEAAYASYAANFLYGNDDTQSFEASMQDSAALFSLVKGFSASRLSQSLSGVSPKTTIECDDGVVLEGEDDALVCPEKNVQPKVAIEELRKDPTVSAFMDIANSYGSCKGQEVAGTCYGFRPRTYIRPILRAVSWFTGKVSDGVFSAVKSVPYVGEALDSAQNWMGEYAAQFIEWGAKKLFPVAVNAAAEGKELFDQYAAGIDVINNSFLKGYEDEDGALQGLGAKKLTSEESSQLRKQIALEKKEDLKNSSFFARYFDFSNTRSLASISTLAMAENAFGGDTINITPKFDGGSYLDTFASAFGLNKKADALTVYDRQSLFGVAQYGFPLNDPALQADPLTLTPEVCRQNAEAREASKYRNEETGEDEYGVVDVCMLDRVVVDSLTKAYDLDPETQPNTPTGSSYAVGSGFIKGTPIQPDALDLRADCPASPTIQQIGLQSDAFFNKVQRTIMLCSVHGVQINTAFAKQFDDLFNAMQAEGYTINGTYGYRSSAGQAKGYGPNGAGSGTFATPGMSLHQFGAAADISCQGGGQSYVASNGRGRESFLAGVSKYPCLNWVAANSKNYGLLLQCVGESSRQGGGEIRRDDGGCEWWHLSPTGG